jgi:hypothetical protein
MDAGPAEYARFLSGGPGEVTMATHGGRDALRRLSRAGA